MNIGELFVTLGAKMDDKFNQQSNDFINKITKTKDKLAALQKTSDSPVLSGLSKETVNLNELFQNLVIAINHVRIAIEGSVNALGKLGGATGDIYSWADQKAKMDTDENFQAAMSKHLNQGAQPETPELGTPEILSTKTHKKFWTVGDDIKKLKIKLLDLRNAVLEKSGFTGLARDFQKASRESQGLTGFFARFVTGANLARVAIISMGAALIKLVMNAADASEHLFKFALNTGMDTTALQLWEQQAGQAGVQAEEVANSFKDLQRASSSIV
jgi:hypothetical protein